MQMRINFLFEAMGEGGTTPLTFADLANDAAGMQAVLKSANHANSDFDEHHQIAAKLLGYESDPITGVTEDADRFQKLSPPCQVSQHNLSRLSQSSSYICHTIL